jgi:Sulfotransferase domain
VRFPSPLFPYRLAMTLRKPNFFIIGAPKCGTTSIAIWLSRHPNIFLSPLKEPHFFNSAELPGRSIGTLSQYEAIFRDANEERVAIGERSVWYLSSTEAVSAILNYQPEAKFIVMLRNPIEMAPAVHGEMMLAGLEYEWSFTRAWGLQDKRRQGKHMLSKDRWAQRYFQYGDICSLGFQLQRLLMNVPSHKILAVILDDVRADARREYLRVLKFLDVPDDGRVNFPLYNPAKGFRWPSLERLVYPTLALKSRLGVRTGLRRWIQTDKVMRAERPRKALTPEAVSVLKEYFRKDVELLGQLLGRDLERWLA